MNNAILENFLTHHKRGCPANRGTNCTCGLYEARAELAELRAIKAAARKLVDISRKARDYETYQEHGGEINIAMGKLDAALTALNESESK